MCRTAGISSSRSNRQKGPPPPRKPDSNREFPPLPALIAPSSYCAWCTVKHCHSDGHLQGTQPRTLIHTQFLDVESFTSLFSKTFSFVQADHVLPSVAKLHPPSFNIKRPSTMPHVSHFNVYITVCLWFQAVLISHVRTPPGICPKLSCPSLRTRALNLRFDSSLDRSLKASARNSWDAVDCELNQPSW